MTSQPLEQPGATAASKRTSIMDGGWHGPWLAWSCVALGLLAVATPLDRALATWPSTAPPDLIAVAKVVTAFGKSGYMFALSAAIAAAAFIIARSQSDPHRRARLLHWGYGSLFFFTSIAVSGLLAQALKHSIGRVRPATSLLTTGPYTFHPFSMADSFPSGHTTSAFAAAVALGLLDRRLRLALLAAACAIGVSRVLVGAHYPSDVVAGAALGSATSLLVVPWFRRWLDPVLGRDVHRLPGGGAGGVNA